MAPGTPPTFSVVVETDNLAALDLDELRRCLDTLNRQGALLREADRVVVADGGVVPDSVLQELTRRYPWLTILRADAGSSYIALKSEGVRQCPSDVIVFCDSDVQYEPGWLAALIEGFQKRPESDVIAGETTTRISGPYSLAVALTFNFPRFTGESELAPSATYWANNLAARRTTLERTPLPDPSGLFRAQSAVHVNRILAEGGVILRQPAARGWHAVLPPRKILRRYFALGRDAGAIRRITTAESGRPYLGTMAPDPPNSGVIGRLSSRLRQVARSQPSSLAWLPLSLPILALLGIAYVCGRVSYGRVPVHS
jgi:glycosyltransferase involved in cell wall biosynthesis